MSGLNSGSVSVASAPHNRKRNPDFSQGKIYFLRSKLDPRIYIGSTTKPRYRREISHRSMAKSGNSKVYQVMREVGIDSYYLEIVEEYPCNSLEELERREFSYIEEVPPAILLNTDLKYRLMSEEHHLNMMESLENRDYTLQKNPHWNGGTCYHEPNASRWRVQWYSDKKRKSKNFSYGPKGKCASEEEARKSAEEFKASLTFDQPIQL